MTEPKEYVAQTSFVGVRGAVYRGDKFTATAEELKGYPSEWYGDKPPADPAAPQRDEGALSPEETARLAADTAKANAEGGAPQSSPGQPDAGKTLGPDGKKATNK